MEESKAIDTTTFEKEVLAHLNDNECIENTETYQAEKAITKDILEAILKSLSAEEYIKLDVIERKEIELTNEGKSYATDGSPEYQFVSKMELNESVDLPTMEGRVGR